MKAAKGSTPASGADLLRQIPSVEELLNRPSIRQLAAGTGRRFVTAQIREVLAQIRERLYKNSDPSVKPTALLLDLENEIAASVTKALAFSLRPVINATGVILHTNLGRAPLSREAIEHLIEVSTQYSNLEFDLQTGARGERDSHISRLLEDLLGAPGIAVNNNAAGVLLTLNALAEGGEVIVSRGELVEIGGSFRIPDIMAKSGAILREVGTTNRTRIGDYASAINERTKLLLRVHPSNFRIVGFTERPSVEELTELSKRAGIPVYEDLGSGCLIAGGIAERLDEAPATLSLAAGVDIVSFSGDKLLGGPQAGLIVGKKELVARIRRNPLFRVLRVDKMTYAVLEATLQAYRQDRLDKIPAWKMISMPLTEVQERSERFIAACGGSGANGLRMEIVDGESVIGGGSAPGQTIPTRLVSISHEALSATVIAARLMAANPPVVARTEIGATLLDLRTVFPTQEEILAETIVSIAASSSSPV